MGFTKRTLEREEDLRELAAEIAKRSGALTECEYHDGVYIDCGDAEPAFRLANYLYTQNDDLIDEFESRREMTDTIQAVFDDAAWSRCPLCQKLFEED